MTSYRYIGYGVTNSNGVAHLDHDPQGNSINGYTGTGAGEVDVVASLDNPVVEGSIVSETFIVDDTYKYDLATITKHTDFWTKVYGDEEFTIADVVLLQKWLLAVPDTKLADWKAADFCKDDRLDVFDLCLMRKALLK